MRHLKIALQGVTIATISVGILLWAHAVHAIFWAVVTGHPFMECFQSPLIALTCAIAFVACFARACSNGQR